MHRWRFTVLHVRHTYGHIHDFHKLLHHQGMGINNKRILRTSSSSIHRDKGLNSLHQRRSTNNLICTDGCSGSMHRKLLPFHLEFNGITCDVPNYSHCIRLRRAYLSMVKGKLVYHQQLSCHAKAICEMIQCTLCWESIYSLHCWDKLHLIMAGIIAIFGLIGLTILSPLFKCVAILARTMSRMCRCAVRGLLSRRKRPSGFRHYTGYRRKLVIAVIIVGLQLSSSCSDLSFTASEEMCITTQTNQTCTYNQATILTLQPLDQETCLLLKDNNDKSVGLLTIRIENIYYTCQKRVEFYTRDHHFYSESVHRCRFAGSCKMDTCDNTKTTDRIDEFSRAANSHPRFTFCAASCGCLTCGGSFLCMASCLFYRYYAYPESTIIYEVFNCPTWKLAVEIQVTIQNQEMENEATTLTLHPGRTARWNQVLLSLIGTTTPQIPILSSTFITDGKTTGITKKVSSGHLIPHTVGQLQCKDKQAARKFNCSFPSNVCTCSTATNQASCTCSNTNIGESLTKSPLPVTTKNVIIYQDRNTVKAKMGVGTIMQMHLVAEELKLTTTKQNTTCTVIVSHLNGCYKCLSGARVELACHAQNGHVTAEINCGHHKQIAVCTKTGHINKLTFNFDTAIVNESCTLSCPGSLTEFTVSGQLEYVNDGLHFNNEIVTNERAEASFEFPTASLISFLTITFAFVSDFISSLLTLNSIFFLLTLPVILSIFNSFRSQLLSKKRT